MASTSQQVTAAIVFAVGLSISGPAVGQSVLSPETLAKPVTTRPGQWDYRFDAQYQSTIKPYLRWYMRNDPSRPGQRYLPRDYGRDRQLVSIYVADYHCYLHNMPGYILTPTGPSVYWDHLRYLQDKYGHTPLVRPAQSPRNQSFRSRSLLQEELVPESPNGDDADSYDDNPGTTLRSTAVNRKTVWVSRSENLGTISVLYHPPPPTLADRFSQATVTLDSGANILAIRWIDEPVWGKDVYVAKGQLHSKS